MEVVSFSGSPGLANSVITVMSLSSNSNLLQCQEAMKMGMGSRQCWGISDAISNSCLNILTVPLSSI